MGEIKESWRSYCRGQKQGIMVSQSRALATEMEINEWFEIYFINKIDRAGKWIKCGEYLREASLWPLGFLILGSWTNSHLIFSDTKQLKNIVFTGMAIEFS